MLNWTAWNTHVNCIFSLNWIVWNRTVFDNETVLMLNSIVWNINIYDKLCTYVKLNCLKKNCLFV